MKINVVFHNLFCSGMFLFLHKLPFRRILWEFSRLFFATLVLKESGVFLFIINLAFFNKMKIFTPNGLLFCSLTWSAKWSYL